MIVEQAPRFKLGQWVKVRLGALCGEEIIEEGVIVECQSTPPKNASHKLAEEPFWYRLQGRQTFCRESLISTP